MFCQFYYVNRRFFASSKFAFYHIWLNVQLSYTAVRFLLTRVHTRVILLNFSEHPLFYEIRCRSDAERVIKHKTCGPGAESQTATDERLMAIEKGSDTANCYTTTLTNCVTQTGRCNETRF